MSIFSGLQNIVKPDCSLREHTWYRLGGRADYLIVPENLEQLQAVVRRCNENNIPMRVLGSGSNVLVSDEGIKAAVIKLGGEDFARVSYQKDKLQVWAGANLNKLAMDCVRKGLSGLEAVTGIPGSVGGAVRMNAGGQFGDIGSAVESVTLMDKLGNIFEKSKPELDFDYRQVNITAKFILNAEIKLTKEDPDQILRAVKEIWIFKKNTQPLNARCAGCIFKNPPGQAAGALIDRAGLKGLSVGGAVVSEKHANFIIANDGCTSGDVIRLIDVIRRRVQDQLGVQLELEIEIW
ncbi:MAG: UDP-N-acetylmuramate dehydrogenase [Planctomycetota bacterium]